MNTLRRLLLFGQNSRESECTENDRWPITADEQLSKIIFNKTFIYEMIFFSFLGKLKMHYNCRSESFIETVPLWHRVQTERLIWMRWIRDDVTVWIVDDVLWSSTHSFISVSSLDSTRHYPAIENFRCILFSSFTHSIVYESILHSRDEFFVSTENDFILKSNWKLILFYMIVRFETEIRFNQMNIFICVFIFESSTDSIRGFVDTVRTFSYIFLFRSKSIFKWTLSRMRKFSCDFSS